MRERVGFAPESASESISESRGRIVKVNHGSKGHGVRVLTDYRQVSEHPRSCVGARLSMHACARAWIAAGSGEHEREARLWVRE